ncbi:hypothetical protein XENOCAPTIV_002004, partial [Xenoophorus captivus]
PGDVKARFRRAQAYQKLGRLDQAFLDAQRCAQLEPKTRAFQDLLRQLGTQIQQKTMAIVNELGMDQLCAVMGSGASTVSLAACHLLQVMFEALTEGMKREIRGKDEAILPEPSKELRSMLRHLLEMMPAPNVSGPGRDSAINLLVKQVPRKSLKNPDNSLALWVIDQGLKKILQVAGTVAELSEGPSLTENTHMSCSVLLSKLYDDLKSDKERENFNKLCEDYVQRPGLDAKLRAIQTVSVLLQGPSDVGNVTLEMSGMMDAVISLCGSEDVTHQQVAVEALIHAAGKAKRASFITANGVALLKDLYKKSENDRIRVRALVGLCKLGSAGGTDFSMKQFAEGSTLKLAKQWLCNESLPPTSRRWSVEGLAYLTFDADVKEDLVEDKSALLAMVFLALVERQEDRGAVVAQGGGKVQKLFLASGNDRLKLLVLYCGEEDERLRKAAAGTLAMLTAEQPELCTRIPGTVGRPFLIYS